MIVYSDDPLVNALFMDELCPGELEDTSKNHVVLWLDEDNDEAQTEV